MCSVNESVKTLVVTFTLIVFKDHYVYKDNWNSVVGETLNCEYEVHGWFKEIWHYIWPCNTCHFMHLHVIFKAW